MGRTALILGAGLGGTIAAKILRKRLPREDRVVVVDQATEHVFPPSLLWLLVGDRQIAQITRPVSRIQRHGVEFVQGAVTRIDPANRSVEAGGQRFSGDAVVIALGADYAPEAIPGLSNSGHCLYTIEGAQAACDALAAFRGGRIALLTAAAAYKCPAAPYEAALLVDDYLRKRGVREKTQIDFFAAEPGPMLVAGPAMSAAVRGMVEQRGIAFHPEHQVTQIDAGARRLSFANGAAAEFDLLLYVPPHRAPAAVRDAGLTNESGWIPVDRHTLETKFPAVYAIGDVTVIPLKMGRPLPKAGVFAHGEAEVVADNIARAWAGRGEPGRFDGDGSCFIEIGDKRAAMGYGNFYAEPVPEVKMRNPSPLWHLGKVIYEKYWLYTRF